MLTIDLRNRTALVLGGSRGIGASITEHLCRAGASVLFTHTGNPANHSRIDSLVEDIARAGGTVRAVAADALDADKTEEVAAQIVREHGKLDILVSNVGKNVARLPEAVTDDEWRNNIDVNLSSAFYGVRAVLPPMKRAGYGKIILIGSSVVHSGGGGAIDYAAAKAGLAGMMAYLCRVFLKDGIRSNIVHPCVIETDLLAERYGSPEGRAKLISQIPVGRLGRPEDIAGLVAFLASAWGDYICGQEILADGGRTLFNG